MSSIGNTLLNPGIPVSVWIRGRPIPGWDPAHWRHDDYGHVIKFDQYGDRSAEFGWERDHIVPRALGGSDHPSNLRPLHCKRNSSLGGILGGLLDP